MALPYNKKKKNKLVLSNISFAIGCVILFFVSAKLFSQLDSGLKEFILITIESAFGLFLIYLRNKNEDYKLLIDSMEVLILIMIPASYSIRFFPLQEYFVLSVLPFFGALFSWYVFSHFKIEKMKKSEQVKQDLSLITTLYGTLITTGIISIMLIIQLVSSLWPR